MKRNPLTYILLSVILGILSSNFFSFKFSFYWVISTLLLVLFFYFYKPKFYAYFIILFFISIGFFSVSNYNKITENHYTNLIKSNHYFKFKPLESVNSTDFYHKYIVEIQAISLQNKWIKTSGKALVKIKISKDKPLNFRYSYLWFGNLKLIESPKNPHQFDYQKFMKNKLVLYEFKMDSIHSKQAEKFNLNAEIEQLKQNTSEKILHSNYSNESKSLLQALTIGDRTQMSQELIEEFSKSGIIHFISISGTHILALYLIINWLLNLLFGKITSKNKIILFTILFIWSYGIFVGLAPSVFRACLMITIYQIGIVFIRPQKLNESLVISALIILLINPNQLYDLGFQLSFSAVFFIGLLNPSLEKISNRYLRFLPQLLRSILSITFAAQIGTLPLTLYYFHQTSLLSIFTNLLIVPFASFILIVSFICLFQVLILPKLDFLYYFYDFLVLIIRKITHFVANQNLFMIQDVNITFIQIIALFGIIYYFYKLLKEKYKIYSLKMILFIGFIFQISLIFKHFQTKNKDEFLIFHQPFNSVFAIKKGYAVNFYIQDTTKIKMLEKFTIIPYKIGENIENSSVKLIPKSAFINYKNMVIFRPTHSFKEIYKPKFDILWISNSVKLNLDSLNLTDLKYLVVDGSNYPYYQDELKKKAKEKNLLTKLWLTNEKGAFKIKY